jgi:hypothetical protein
VCSIAVPCSYATDTSRSDRSVSRQLRIRSNTFGENIFRFYVIVEFFTVMIIKNVVFWDIKTQFVPHRRNITSPLQSAAS